MSRLRVLVLGAVLSTLVAVPGQSSLRSPDHPTLHGLHRPGPTTAARVAQYGEGDWLEAVTAISAATPGAECETGAPETGTQGRVPASDYASGRALDPYSCNAELVSRYGVGGGFNVHRYVDAAGNECAYYDSSLIFGRELPKGADPGVYVMDMSDPAQPVRTSVLQSPAMLSPHESLRLNQARGLLVANMGSPEAYPGFVDVWDVSADCRKPVFRASVLLSHLGHEGGFSPDGLTYWVAATASPGITAIDLTDPSNPVAVWRTLDYAVHGLSISADGNRAYLAEVADYATTTTMGAGGFTILDVSEIQARVANPQAREVGSLTWPEVTIPQNNVPVTIGGRPYAIHFDEYDVNVWTYDPEEVVGGVRIIDLSDETAPVTASRIRLQAHQREARRTDQADDPGAQMVGQGYASHYCSVPRTVDPGIVACGMIASGLRVFDIRDPSAPREIAYYNQAAVPVNPGDNSGAYAMSGPAFAPERGEIWYSDANSGFFVVRLTGAARDLLLASAG